MQSKDTRPPFSTGRDVWVGCCYIADHRVLALSYGESVNGTCAGGAWSLVLWGLSSCLMLAFILHVRRPAGVTVRRYLFGRLFVRTGL